MTNRSTNEGNCMSSYNNRITDCIGSCVFNYALSPPVICTVSFGTATIRTKYFTHNTYPILLTFKYTPFKAPAFLMSTP